MTAKYGPVIQTRSAKWLVQNFVQSQDKFKVYHVPMGATTAWGSAVLTGSGAVSTDGRLRRVDSASTATSTAMTRLASALGNQGWQVGQATTIINWSKIVIVSMTFRHRGGTTNGVARATLGKSISGAIGAPTVRSVGFRILNTTLVGLVHDGTNPTATATLATVAATNLRTLVIVSWGDGNVDFILDGTITSTTGGPTGNGTADDDGFQMEVDNGGDSALQSWDLHDLVLGFEQ